MPYYGVAIGRNTGVYDNWEDCRDQVDGYSHNKYKKFDTPDQAWDFVDQHSSRSDTRQTYDSNTKTVACRSNDNQIALRGGHMEANSYQRTDYTTGRNTTIVRQRSYASGRDGNGYFVEKSIRTYWRNC
ncbi:ribonuclease H [Solenopsis invicta]|uniref:ribonuclease H n=1 Tax=Solenopsis invicta TaxID=13686 RepID=UPI000596230A|nr:ribonuclease H [Solenopsis invicta]XP_025991819.1 ribonuclease H [Solenopsis invicta]